MPHHPSTIPLINISPLISETAAASGVAAEIGRACREYGFFYIVGHGVDRELTQRLEQVSRRFFDLDLESKRAIRMERGRHAWRGYFPVGTELTLGRPDQKEGLYFGEELTEDDPRVQAKIPLHGRNLFPEIPDFRETVLAYLAAMTGLGHSLMKGLALSLGLHGSYFAEHYTSDPLILFRIFHYPSLRNSTSYPADPESRLVADSDASTASRSRSVSGQPEPSFDRSATSSEVWSVGEHTDYGLLTILLQDDAGGLQVKSKSRWIAAPPVPGAFVCNIGDMLDRLTGGEYRSTPHRVLNESTRSRLSFPFFFDPNFAAEVKPIDPRASLFEDAQQRWDGSSVHELQGTYGEYLMKKVSRVFPELGRETL